LQDAGHTLHRLRPSLQPVTCHLKPMILKCPRCGKETESMANPYRPFCSERCKLLDLGNWISGAYRISRKSEDEDENGESPHDEDSEKE
jgi:endogenous inhibitor of DNA gyrase (YacG/DUF329 family)